MITSVTVRTGSLKELASAVKAVGKDLRKELKIAVNATAKKSKSIINKEIRTELANTTSKTVYFTIKVHLSPSLNNPSARIEVKKTDRLSLRSFKPRQTRAGVSYQISKTRGRKTATGAFINTTKLHGGVFKRVGPERLPIIKLRGVSPWGVMTKGGKLGPSKEETSIELRKQIQKRIRFLTLKASGAI